MNINMTDITEKTENGELVTNRDQLVVMDNIESLIKVIRGQQRYEREYSNIVEKPRDFDPFGHAGLSPLVTI